MTCSIFLKKKNLKSKFQTMNQEDGKEKKLAYSTIMLTTG